MSLEAFRTHDSISLGMFLRRANVFSEPPYDLSLPQEREFAVDRGCTRIKLTCDQPFFGVHQLSDEDVEAKLCSDNEKYNRLRNGTEVSNQSLHSEQRYVPAAAIAPI